MLKAQDEPIPPRWGHTFIGFVTAEAKAHYDRLLGDIVRELKIVPKKYGEQDDRPRWSVRTC